MEILASLPCERKNVDRPTILVLATLDTKGPETEFLRQRIELRGERAIIIDSGVVGKPQAKADITRRQVASAGGKSLDQLLVHPTREEAAGVMAAGATKIAPGPDCHRASTSHRFPRRNSGNHAEHCRHAGVALRLSENHGFDHGFW